MNGYNGNQMDPSNPYWGDWFRDVIPWIFKILCVVVVIMFIIVCLVNPAAAPAIGTLIGLFSGLIQAMNG